ncbi:MAG: hypothetical protein WD738_19575 [Pirellulales bacterium]
MNLNDHVWAPPLVRLVGQFDHPDLEDAVELLRAGAQIIASPDVPPELIVVAQSRPGEISDQTIKSLRRCAPLSGLVALLGTWCEGETRNGRPWPGVERLYWYEFPAWWRRQLALRAAGHCPDWARAHGFAQASRVVPDPGRGRGLPGSPPIRNSARGLIVLSAAVRETAAALADILQQAGYASVWQSPARPAPIVRGAAAGIWEGGQLSEREADHLAAFCRALAPDAAPVIALLDFPRHDRCKLARDLGAAAILGKPWLNSDLIRTMIRTVVANSTRVRAA